MWLLAHRGQIHEDPIVATVRDPASYVVGALVALVLLYAGALSGARPAVERRRSWGRYPARHARRRGPGRLAR